MAKEDTGNAGAKVPHISAFFRQKSPGGGGGRMKPSTKERIMQALLTQPNAKKAAEAAGVTTRTVRAYMADKSFSDEYEARRKALVQDATDQLKKALASAVDTVHEIMTKGANNEKLTACRMIFEYCLKYTELYDISARLDAVEEVLKDR